MLRSIATVSIGGVSRREAQDHRGSRLRCGRNLRERFYLLRRLRPGRRQHVRGSRPPHLRPAAISRFRGDARTAAQADLPQGGKEIRPDAGARHRSLARLQQCLAGRARRNRPCRRRPSRTGRAGGRAGPARRFRGAGVGTLCQRLQGCLGNRPASQPLRNRDHSGQLPYLGARLFPSPRSRAIPADSDIPGSARRCSATRPRCSLVEQAFSLLSRDRATFPSGISCRRSIPPDTRDLCLSKSSTTSSARNRPGRSQSTACAR